MTELINTHCHTKYCGHGEGEVQEYVDAARAANLTTLAFTDHFPLSAAFDPTGYLSVPREDLPAYENAVKAARDTYSEIDILLGVEMDYLANDDDRADVYEEMARYDIVLGSVHFVDKWPFDDPAQRSAWDEPGRADHIWRRYIDLWCEAASDKSLPFDVMSHPDLAKKFAYMPSFDLKDSYEKMAEAAREGGRLVEVNTSGSYYACAEMFPAPALLEAFCRAGVPCTVGTDAHIPSNVARDIEKAYKLMYDSGYREITVPMKAHDRRHIAL